MAADQTRLARAENKPTTELKATRLHLFNLTTHDGQDIPQMTGSDHQRLLPGSNHGRMRGRLCSPACCVIEYHSFGVTFESRGVGHSWRSGLSSQPTNEDERTFAGIVCPHKTVVCRAGLKYGLLQPQPRHKGES